MRLRGGSELCRSECLGLGERLCVRLCGSGSLGDLGAELCSSSVGFRRCRFCCADQRDFRLKLHLRQHSLACGDL